MHSIMAVHSALAVLRPSCEQEGTGSSKMSGLKIHFGFYGWIPQTNKAGSRSQQNNVFDHSSKYYNLQF